MRLPPGALLLSLIAAAAGAPATIARADQQERILESSRFLGRGDTFVAASDSDESSRGNPAAIADGNVKFQIRWLQLDVLIGQNSLDSIKEVQNLSGSSSAVGLLRTFSTKFGKEQYVRAQAAPVALRFGNFELMPYASSVNYVDLRDPVLPDVHFHSDSQYGVSLSYAIELSKTLSFGLTLRPAERTLFDGDVSFSDLLKFVDSSNFQLSDLTNQKQGMMFGADAGLMYKPGANWRFGLLVENIGYAGPVGTAATAPPPETQRVDAGLQYRVDWKPWHWDFLVDGQDLVDPEHYEVLRLLHVGTELGRSYVSRDNDVGLDAGINEGYFTLGAFLDIILARLQVSYYAVELGEYPGQRKDRRWGATLVSSTTF